MACRAALFSIGIVAVIAAAGSAGRARATCGSDMCTVDSRGPESIVNRYSFEMSYQYINQDQVRVGTEPGVVGQLPAHHNEIQTITDTWTFTGRAVITPRFLVSATMPYMQRMHRHEEEHHPGFFVQDRWDFSGLGDVLMTGYWSPSALSRGPYSASLQLGLKAPTGRRNVEEIAGEQPEPMARPSTGSWDGLAGAQVRRAVVTHALSGASVPVTYSLGVQGRLNGKGTDDFSLGNELTVNLAGGWGLTQDVSFLGQINTRIRGKDQPGLTDTEADHTGGTAIYATPGIRVGMGAASAYSYFQARVYEKVNGIQITAPSHLMFGMSYSF